MPAIGRFELWMLAHVALGLVGMGGVLFLVPTYVLAQGGTPSDVGAVMAIGSGLALTGPAFGAFADRFGAHRLVQLGSMTLLLLAAVLLPFTNEELTWMISAGLFGLGIAGLSVVNPTLIVGAGLEHSEQTHKLALMQMCVPAGQVLGLAMISALMAAGWELPQLFFLLAGIMAVFTVIVALVNAPAAARVGAAASTSASSTENVPAPKMSLRSVILSQFGLVVLIGMLLTMSAQALESQYPNYMQESFAIDPGTSAGALSVMVLLSLPLYAVAGRWTARQGAKAGLALSTLMRVGAGVGLLLLAKEAGATAFVFYALVMLAYPFAELNLATLVSKTSPMGAGAGQGILGAAFALGTLFVSVIAGLIAGAFGYPALAVITAVTAGLAAVLTILFVRNSKKDALS